MSCKVGSVFVASTQESMFSEKQEGTCQAAVKYACTVWKRNAHVPLRSRNARTARSLERMYRAEAHVSQEVGNACAERL